MLTLRDGTFANPAGLVDYIQKQGSLAKIRPDQKIVFSRDLTRESDRIDAARNMLTRLAKIAQEAA